MAAAQASRAFSWRFLLSWIPPIVLTSVGHAALSCALFGPAETPDKSGASSESTKTKLFIDIKETQWPILYSPHYDIKLYGLQHLVSFHGFDVGKWGKVHSILKEKSMTKDTTVVEPNEAEHSDLLVVHDEDYLEALKTSRYVAGILEFFPVALVPNSVVQSNILTPFRYQTGGTILGAKLALEKGWAINIGGGFHHSRHNQGAGFCVYADITLAIRFLQREHKNLKFMIIDLDAHQGNGHERDFREDPNVYIMDVYNKDIYPDDKWAKKAINKQVEVVTGIEDEAYLEKVKMNMKAALKEFKPDLVVYNAGTDILQGDPLGKMNITPQGVITRDEMVFRELRERKPPIPVLMVTSGGYQSTNAAVIADSILNLREKKLISPPEGDSLPDGEDSTLASSTKQADGTPPPPSATRSAQSKDSNSSGKWSFTKLFTKQ